MRVILELDAGVARSLQQSSDGHSTHPLAAELQRLAVQLGVHLQPLHPGVAEPRLASYFFADIAADAAPGVALEQLRKCAAVSAAYAKPADEAPQ